MTKSGEDHHSLHLKSLKEKLYLQWYFPSWNFREKKLNGVFQEHLINGKVGFLDKIKRKNLKTGISRLELNQKNSQKVKLFQLFMRIARHLDILLSLEEAFLYFILPLYLYQSQLLMKIWNSQGQKRYLLEIISIKNEKHHIQFHWKMPNGLLLHP